MRKEKDLSEKIDKLTNKMNSLADNEILSPEDMNKIIEYSDSRTRMLNVKCGFKLNQTGTILIKILSSREDSNPCQVSSFFRVDFKSEEVETPSPPQESPTTTAPTAQSLWLVGVVVAVVVVVVVLVILSPLILRARERKAVSGTILLGDPSRLDLSLPPLSQPRYLGYDRRFERRRSSLEIQHFIGEGEFGAVFVGTIRNIYGSEKTKVAVKLAKHIQDHNHLYMIIDELKLMSNMEMHPNLVNLLAACTSNSKLEDVKLIMEHCPNGNLEDFLKLHRPEFKASLQNKARDGGSLDSELLYRWAYEVGKGLEFLSSKSIMHGDLAARNILLSEDLVAKISDFGLSKKMYYNTSKT